MMSLIVRIVYFIFLCCFPLILNAVGSKAEVVLKHTYSFQFDKAEKALERVPPGWREYAENKNIFFQIILNEGPEDVTILTKKIFANIQSLKKENLPIILQAHFVAESELMLGVIQMQDQRATASAVHLYKAYTNYEKLLKDYPEYYQAQIGYRFLRIAIAVMPQQYKKFASLLGMKGNVQEDVQVLHNLLLEDKLTGIYRDEVITMMEYLDLHYSLREFIPEDEWEAFRSDLPIFHFIRMHHNFKDRNPEQAILNLDKASKHSKANFLNYYYGKSYYILNDSRCESYLKKFIILNRSRDFIKSAAFYLANYTLCNYGRDKSLVYKEMTLQKGDLNTGPDKLAYQIVQLDREKLLIKASLLYDAGKYQESINILEDYKEKSVLEAVELNYRLANNYWVMGKVDKALQHFNMVFEKSDKLPLYFAPKAALKLGLYYKDLGDVGAAMNYFNKVLNYSKYPFEKDFKSKAKYHLAAIAKKKH